MTLSAPDAFALSVEVADALLAQGLPVAGARHGGEDVVAVAFNTPRGAVAVVSVPSGANFSALVARIRRIRRLARGQDGFK